jgi:CHAD domain-containing protein
MIPVGRQLEHLRAYLAIARVGDEPEGVHQVRVASRRIDAWLRLRGQRTLRDDLRWLRTSVSRARDLDVLLRRDLPPEVSQWLGDKRRAEQPKLRALLDDGRTEALLEALGALPPADVDLARASIRGILKSVLKRGRAVDQASADTEALHRLRRGLRRLRFSLEWIGEDARELVELQDAFGELNDRAVLLRWLGEYPDADGTAAWRAEVFEELDRKRIAVVQVWRESESDVEAMLDTWTSS